jgi:hypothetical protein
MGHTETILDRYRNGASYTAQALYDLSHYAAKYMYNNYTSQSDSSVAWNFGGISDETPDPGGDDPPPDEEEDPGDPDPPSDNGGFFTQFMLWLLGLFG